MLRGKYDNNSEKIGSKDPFAANNLFEDSHHDAPPAYPEALLAASHALPAYSEALLVESDAPSACSEPLPVASSVASSSAPPYLPHITSEDNKYAFLSSLDTIFVVDDSGSMAGHPWGEVAAVLRSITPICTAHDEDGVDLYFLNHKSTEVPKDDSKPTGGHYRIKTPDKMQEAFQKARPTGPTPTGTRLWSILDPYIARLDPQKNEKEDIEKVKPINIIVITDGCPTDKLESVITACAKRLDDFNTSPHQVGIQFFQIGNLKDATEALRRLDDELPKQGVRDMVDTVTWDGKSSDGRKGLTADGMLKVVLGGVIRRLDRRPSADRPKS